MTTGVSAATVFSRTLQTLQLWLVSLPGRGSDQMLGPGGRALVDRIVGELRSQVSTSASSAGPWNSCNA